MMVGTLFVVDFMKVYLKWIVFINCEGLLLNVVCLFNLKVL